MSAHVCTLAISLLLCSAVLTEKSSSYMYVLGQGRTAPPFCVSSYVSVEADDTAGRPAECAQDRALSISE